MKANNLPILILHIGAEKTGSTALQCYCEENAPYLESSIRYPTVDELPATYRGNHMGLALASGAPWAWNYDLGKRFGSDGLTEFRKRFFLSLDSIIGRRELEGNWTSLMLSNEHLSSTLTFKDVKELCSLLKARFSAIQIILVCRNPYDAAVSKWTTSVRAGGKASLNRFLETEATLPGFDYASIVSMWRASGCNVSCINYSRNSLYHVLETAGIALEHSSLKRSEINVSPGLLGIEIMRVLNILGCPPGRDKLSLGRRLSSILDQTMKKASQRKIVMKLVEDDIILVYTRKITDFNEFLRSEGVA